MSVEWSTWLAQSPEVGGGAAGILRRQNGSTHGGFGLKAVVLTSLWFGCKCCGPSHVAFEGELHHPPLPGGEGHHWERPQA